MKSKFRNCPLCRNSSATILRFLSYALFDDSPLSDSYDLLACNKCNFIYCDTKSTSIDFYNYYKQNLHYIYTTSPGTGTNEIERYSSILHTLQKYQLNKESIIVDIGSAKGGFLSFLKKQDYRNLIAVDLLPECIDYIKTKNINAKIGSAEKLPLQNKSADIIILSHVLEHIINLQTVMNELSRVISNEGLIYAEVPTIEYGHSFKNAPLWDFPYEHINYFSMRHLISLFENNQFSCLESYVKEIHNGNGVTKCICAIFKKSNKEEVNTIQEDILINPELLEIIKDRTPCYVWGISEYMQLLTRELLIKKCNIVSFLDKSEYKQTKTINKIPIRSPYIIRNNTDSKVAIIFPAEPYSDDMNKYLDQINFSGKRITI